MPDGTGSTRQWTWVSARGEWAMSDVLVLSGGVGHRDQDLGVDYSVWDLGASAKVNDSLEVDLRYHDTSANAHSAQYGSAIVIGLEASF